MVQRFLLLAVLCAPLAVCAQQKRDYGELVGAGLMVRPAYQGADTMVTQVIPMLRLFGEHWFARTTQGVLEGGYRVPLTSTLTTGVQLTYEPGRLTQDSAFLKSYNVPTLDWSTALGVHLEWDDDIGPAPVNALARWRQNLDLDQGAKADLRFTVGVVGTERLNAGVFTQLTWSSEKANQTYFGITSSESAATGLPMYSAGAGLRYGVIGLIAGYDLARHWVILGSAEVHQLMGSAKGSPFTQDSTNWYFTLGLTYRF
jgi:MipA family protein